MQIELKVFVKVLKQLWNHIMVLVILPILWDWEMSAEIKVKMNQEIHDQVVLLDFIQQLKDLVLKWHNHSHGRLTTLTREGIQMELWILTTLTTKDMPLKVDQKTNLNSRLVLWLIISMTISIYKTILMQIQENKIWTTLPVIITCSQMGLLVVQILELSNTLRIHQFIIDIYLKLVWTRLKIMSIVEDKGTKVRIRWDRVRILRHHQMLYNI